MKRNLLKKNNKVKSKNQETLMLRYQKHRRRTYSNQTFWKMIHSRKTYRMMAYSRKTYSKKTYRNSTQTKKMHKSHPQL